MMIFQIKLIMNIGLISMGYKLIHKKLNFNCNKIITNKLKNIMIILSLLINFNNSNLIIFQIIIKFNKKILI